MKFLKYFSLLLFIQKVCSTPCDLRAYRTGLVCVCNSSYCDTLDVKLPKIKGEVLILSTSKSGLRYHATKSHFGSDRIKILHGPYHYGTSGKSKSYQIIAQSISKLEKAYETLTETTAYISTNYSATYQKIIGFGGAFTGSVSFNLKQLQSNELRHHVYKSFYSKQKGNGFNFMRYPIGGCDFDLEPWAYNEQPEHDPDLSNFKQLDQRDLDKIDQLNELRSVTNNHDIKFVGAAWSPPRWMKTNNDWTGFSALRIEYYQTWADYHVRFLELMHDKNISFWGISTGNEPLNGVLFPNFIHFMSLGWLPKDQGRWVADHLGPTLKNSLTASKVKILAGDDQRYTFPWWFEKMYDANPDVAKYIDGMAVHWYADKYAGSNTLDDAEKLFPDKFFLSTEACSGDKPWEIHEPILGHWPRCEDYILDIIEDLNHYMSGWIDWNLILDLDGGPNYVMNTLDAPMIANGSEIYKQPIFYGLGHFSRFIIPGSQRIYSKSTSPFIKSTAFLRPDGLTAIVFYNNGDHYIDVNVLDKSRGVLTINVPGKSVHTVIYKSHKLLPDNLCSQHNEMFMEIIFRYFNDQHFLTAVELPDVFDQRMDVLRCFGANSIRPIDLFNTLNMKFGAKVDTSSVSSFPTTHGFYANVRNETSLFKLFEKVASFNPRTKLMVSVEEISSDLVKESLTVGYKKFKLLNIALLTSIARRIDKEDFDHEIVLCQYNPFTDDRNNLEYPMHHCLDFTPKNMKENLIQMEDFQKLRLGNLRGFPLRISLFEYEMKSVAVYDEYGRITHYIYPDGELVTVLAKYMNFTPAYLPEIGNGLKYGFQSPSGIFEGALGDSEYDRADLLANPKLIADYNTTNSVFLRPTAMTKLYFIIKKRITYKKTILSFFSIFDDISMWIIISLFIIFPISYSLINRIETFLVTGRKKCVFGRNTLYIFQLLNNISSRHSNLNASRITAALVFFYALVTTALFQGSLIQKLNLNQNAGSLNKIEELFENNFTIAMAPILSFVFTVQGTDRVTKRIMEASNGDVTEIVMRSDDAMEELAYNEKLAFLWIEEATGTFLNRFYDNLTGENLFERVPESAFEFYIAMMLPKSSPFIDRFNHFINIYVEAGLYQYHVKKAAEDNEKVWIQRIREGKVPKQNSRTLEMDDLKIAFKLYLFFVVAATIAFFFECLLSFASKRLKCRKFR